MVVEKYVLNEQFLEGSQQSKQCNCSFSQFIQINLLRIKCPFRRVLILTFLNMSCCMQKAFKLFCISSAESSITSDMQITPLLMAKSKEELKSLLKVKEESEKAGLKLNIQKMKITAFGPITSWQIDGETMKTVTDFIFLGYKITADGECSHEIKRCLLLGKKIFDKPRQHIKGRDITLPTKVHLVKAMVFPVVMYGCKS